MDSKYIYEKGLNQLLLKLFLKLLSGGSYSSSFRMILFYYLFSRNNLLTRKFDPIGTYMSIEYPHYPVYNYNWLVLSTFDRSLFNF